MNLNPFTLRGLALMAAAFTGTLQAQNLVPNASFEQIIEDARAKDFKVEGMITTHGLEWQGATAVAPDLYYTTGEACEAKGTATKSTKASAPCNFRGYQTPSDGEFYAGFRAYAKSNPKLKRSYLQVQLTEKLEKDQMYCVSFDVSLGELSRYAVNNVGAVLSDRKISTEKDYPLDMEPSVLHKSNKLMQYSEGWETICGTFYGSGEEEFIIIGCFGADVDLEVEKVSSRPVDPSDCKGCFSGKVPQSEAYYFVDNVSVTAITANSQCKCGAADERDMDLVFGSSSNLPDDATPKQRVEDAAVYYAFLKRMPTAAGKATISEVAGLLKANTGMRLEILGHCDDDEFNEGKINVRYKNVGEKRADQVKRLLEAEGIAADRLTVSGRENTDPASTRDSEIARAQNRRVTFVVK
ncbi:MAG: hypothetical protein RLZZ314_1363 [Bacteroidota bacterium]|jgi:outer membrane protein OmpA-like peptidoglycan-associated protein